MDQIVEDLKLDKVNFIKFDIEGAERYAIEGAANTVRKFAPRIALSVYHKVDDLEVLPKLLLNLTDYDYKRKALHGYFLRSKSAK